VHPSGAWGIRYVCGAGHIHKEKVGTLKSEAIRRYHERRGRSHREPGWCPTIEHQREREHAESERETESRRLGFRAYAEEYLAWARKHHRGWRTEESRIQVMIAAFGDAKLDTIKSADVERFLDGLLTGERPRSHSTVNRYRTLLHAILNRAIRHALVLSNAMKGVGRFMEPEGRIKFLVPEEEVAVCQALRPELRPLFLVSVRTGLRWSEQIGLQWRDVDFLTGLITVKRSKSGHSRQVPMNSVVRSMLMDVAGQRERPDDPGESVFRCRHRQADKFFPRAVEREGSRECRSGCEPAGWLYLALQPAQLRESASHGRC
jgi:integrase